MLCRFLLGDRNRPVKVRWSNGDSVIASAVSCGAGHTCVIDVFDDKVKCFGLNNYGQLGDRTNGKTIT